MEIGNRIRVHLDEDVMGGSWTRYFNGKPFCFYWFRDERGTAVSVARAIPGGYTDYRWIEFDQ